LNIYQGLEKLTQKSLAKIKVRTQNHQHKTIYKHPTIKIINKIKSTLNQIQNKTHKKEDS
jgi:hypothetical protein